MNRNIIILLNKAVQEFADKTFYPQKQLVAKQAAKRLFDQHLELECANYLTGKTVRKIDEISLFKQIEKYCVNQ